MIFRVQQVREANRDLPECMVSRCLINDYLIIQNYYFLSCYLALL